MAKDGGSKKAPKKQRWYKVLGEAYRVAKRTYPWARWALLGAAAAGAAIGVVPAIAMGRWITWGIFAVLFAFILPMITLTRMVRTASYKQIDGMPGAVSAVLDRIRRGWTVQAEPVRFNARSQDMVFRAIGRPGIVLITEGPTPRVERLVAEERRAIKRVAPNAPVHVINVGNDEGQTRLIDLNKAMRRLPRGITIQEVAALARRLEALSQKSLPIPKGIDPYKARPDRRAMRGK
jgi:integral membrane protein